MIEHAKKRVQFQQPLAEFHLVQKKIAFAAAHCFAMEAATAECAAFIDQGSPDYMLETAILKVFATEHLWPIVNDTLQVWGGKGYFSDQPIERWMRDARINTIGEGANDVLKAFIAVVGCRGPGMYLKQLQDEVFSGVKGFFKRLPAALGVGAKLVAPWLTTGTPTVPVQVGGAARRCPHAGPARPRVRSEAAARLHGGSRTRRPSRRPNWSTSASPTSPSTCTSPRACCRLDHMLAQGAGNGKASADEPYADVTSGRYFLTLAFRRIRERFAALDDNDDAALLASAEHDWEVLTLGWSAAQLPRCRCRPSPSAVASIALPSCRLRSTS